VQTLLEGRLIPNFHTSAAQVAAGVQERSAAGCSGREVVKGEEELEKRRDKRKYKRDGV
jgi:hypothetical protein